VTSPFTIKDNRSKLKILLLSLVFTLAGLLGACSSSTRSASEEPTAASIDPFTCYIAGIQQGSRPEAVTLTCGGGIATQVPLTEATPPPRFDLAIGDWIITSAAVGTSDIGSSIVRVFTEHAGRECSYYRDLAEPVESTTVRCLGATQ
jgi:hypothetical protein